MQKCEQFRRNRIGISSSWCSNSSWIRAVIDTLLSIYHRQGKKKTYQYQYKFYVSTHINILLSIHRHVNVTRLYRTWHASKLVKKLKILPKLNKVPHQINNQRKCCRKYCTEFPDIKLFLSYKGYQWCMFIIHDGTSALKSEKENCVVISLHVLCRGIFFHSEINIVPYIYR